MKKVLLSFLFGILIVCSTLASVSAINVENSKTAEIQKVNIDELQKGFVNELNANKNLPADKVVLNYLSKNKNKIKI